MALVALLRGVNVGGHRTFRPTELVKQLKHLDAVNIGAAGTLVVHKPIAVAALRAEIVKRLPFVTDIMICQGRDIVAALSHGCYASQREGPDTVRFVTVLAKSPSSALNLPRQFPDKGQWLLQILAQEKRLVFGIYRRHPKVIGYLGMFDKTFGVSTTTRNWNTINAIAKVVQQER